MRPERAKVYLGTILLPLQGVYTEAYLTQGVALGYGIAGLSARFGSRAVKRLMRD